MSALHPARSTPSSLPLELVEEILKYLWDEKATLFASALVSQTWLIASRYHLFASTTLFARRKSSVLHQFAEFLESTPNIACFIHMLKIEKRSFNAGREPRRITLSALAEVIGRLPALQSLHICNVAWNVLSIGDYCPSSPAFSSVTCLQITLPASQIDTTYALHILPWFPCLEELSILGGSFFSHALADTSYFPHELNLRSLAFKSVDTEVPLWSTINLIPYTKSLRSLAVVVKSVDDVASLAYLIHNSNCALRHFSLDFYDLPGVWALNAFQTLHYTATGVPSPGGRLYNSFDVVLIDPWTGMSSERLLSQLGISRWTSLETLALKIHMYSEGHDKHVFYILDQVKSLNIRIIVLELPDYYTVEGIEQWEGWIRLQEVLLEWKGLLREVQFLLPSRPKAHSKLPSDMAIAAIRSHLPMLDEKDILKFIQL